MLGRKLFISLLEDLDFHLENGVQSVRYESMSRSENWTPLDRDVFFFFGWEGAKGELRCLLTDRQAADQSGIFVSLKQ